MRDTSICTVLLCIQLALGLCTTIFCSNDKNELLELFGILMVFSYSPLWFLFFGRAKDNNKWQNNLNGMARECVARIMFCFCFLLLVETASIHWITFQMLRKVFENHIPFYHFKIDTFQNRLSKSFIQHITCWVTSNEGPISLNWFWLYFVLNKPNDPSL